MTDILLLLSSPRGSASHSTRVARALAERLLASQPGSRLTVRDLAGDPLPHIGEDYVSGRVLPREQRTAAQQAAVAVSDQLIAELRQHDVLIVASAMINFSMSSTLKAWFDHVLRHGVTFLYEDGGKPFGLIRRKQVYLVQARGADYSHERYQANDFQQPLITVLLGYMGLVVGHVINVEGVAYDAEQAESRALALLEELPGLQ
ncbi:NAD(P)H-dependent oxidoreductase [Pseudomonas sp. NBRC 100443]|uniref:FMN-dependent NADH-azoreductase n=1 Tax=Pseudomonas sp. NBRC 100443 TaxID=1113665 RepID=UPI0024A0147F|nr:NAD(P)H-dependent oxidoreductase [Pseudomonas sp. NBRC 100443]GLU37336.1 FMN-dependent NADH-azoreductase [Pseudomonas sp. NBRC 100443]